MTKLPIGYAQLTHIESTGTQYIDTGYAWTSENVKAEIGFELVTATNNSFFGSQSTSTRACGLIPYVANGSTSLVFYSGLSEAILPTPIELDAHYDLVCETSDSVLTINLNGIGKTGTYNNSIITGISNALFASNRGTSVVEHSKLRLKYFRMYDNDVLVRDFVPCVNSDNTVGLYDMVDGRFYGNAGTGTFTAGRLVARQLPSGYKRLTHIESTGTQHINTGIDTDFEFIADIQFNPHDDNQAMGRARSAGWYIGVRTSGNYYIDGTQELPGAYNRNTIRMVSSGESTSLTVIGGETISTTKVLSYDTPFTLLGGVMKSDGSYWYCRAKLYSAQFVVGGIPVRDYVPCMTDTGEVGLYDVAFGVFYGNDGTGEFVAGEFVVEWNLGMNFARRRMMANHGGSKYVWAVYDTSYVRDDSTAVTGSFAPNSTRTRMAASAYTVTENGFVLTNPTSVSTTNLQIGHFIVDIGTTANSTATSGAYLYEVTGKSGSFTTTVQYKQYTSKLAKGDVELFRVESNTLDYPLNGIWDGDGLWYVLISVDFVWAVYDFAYAQDEDTAITGSFTATGTRTKMAASAFTANASGFTLTNPTSTSISNLQVGQFLVDIGTYSNSTATTGTYLYEITGISGSTYSKTIQYKRYTVGLIKGENEISRVESKSMDYPVDGIQEGQWYVLIQGVVEYHVWDVYNLATETKYEQYVSSRNDSVRRERGSTVYYGTELEVTPPEWGEGGPRFEIKDASTRTLTEVSNYPAGQLMYFRNKILTFNKRSSNAYSGITDMGDTYSSGVYYVTLTYTEEYSIRSAQVTVRGAATGFTVESADINDYPMDGQKGDYWYVYSHKYAEELGSGNRPSYVYNVYEPQPVYVEGRVGEINSAPTSYYMCTVDFDTSTGLYTIRSCRWYEGTYDPDSLYNGPSATTYWSTKQLSAGDVVATIQHGGSRREVNGNVSYHSSTYGGILDHYVAGEFLYSITADSIKYPISGVQDGLWYELVKN